MFLKFNFKYSSYVVGLTKYFTEHVLGQFKTLGSVSECQAKNFALCEEWDKFWSSPAESSMPSDLALNCIYSPGGKKYLEDIESDGEL